MAPYAQNYTLNVERQLPGQMVLTVAFVGNKGTHTASRLTDKGQDASPILAAGQ